MSVVGQFAHPLEERGGGTAGSERARTLLPAGGNLVQLEENYCWLIWVQLASYSPSSLLQMLPPAVLQHTNFY